jgi:hypothetical protein
VFASSFDLGSALTVMRRIPSISAYPLAGPLKCGRRAALPPIKPYRTLARVPYGNLFVVVVVDVRQRRVVALRSTAACRRRADRDGETQWSTKPPTRAGSTPTGATRCSHDDMRACCCCGLRRSHP